MNPSANVTKEPLHKEEDNACVMKNEYYDILSTEDCLIVVDEQELEIGENIILGYN